jgi:hypothetical protein
MSKAQRKPFYRFQNPSSNMSRFVNAAICFDGMSDFDRGVMRGINLSQVSRYFTRVPRPLLDDAGDGDRRPFLRTIFYLTINAS